MIISSSRLSPHLLEVASNHERCQEMFQAEASQGATVINRTMCASEGERGWQHPTRSSTYNLFFISTIKFLQLF
jgi:hypothetical protein